MVKLMIINSKFQIILSYLLNKFVLFFFLVNYSHNLLSTEISNDPLLVFKNKRTSISSLISKLNLRNKQIDWPNLISKHLEMQKAYAQINRLETLPSDLYNAQFQFRVTNALFQKFVENELIENRISQLQKSEIYSQLFLFENNPLKSTYPEYLSPKLFPDTDADGGPTYPLSYWESIPVYYKYSFQGDELYFRGRWIKSGDVLLNIPSQRPVGIFTSVGEKQSVFPHASIVIFFQTKKGSLPLVLDVFKNGVRLVPLHQFLNPKHISYTELFRFSNPPLDFSTKLDQAARVVLSQKRSYDLTGDPLDRNSLGCPELIDYLLELMGQSKLTMKDKIKSTIYSNILKLGYFSKKFIMPDDILYDGRFVYTGYLDNNFSLKDYIINELLVYQFRNNFDTKIVKEEPNLLLSVTKFVSKEMHSSTSMFSKLLLKLNQIDDGNFPSGDPNLIGAVGVVDLSLKAAMNSCTHYFKNASSSACHDYLVSLLSRFSEEKFSIDWWRKENKLKLLLEKEAGLFNSLFTIPNM